MTYGRKGQPHDPTAHVSSRPLGIPDLKQDTAVTLTLRLEEQVLIFIAVEHHTTECIGIYAVWDIPLHG